VTCSAHARRGGPARRHPERFQHERGSQTLEFALLMPLVAFLAVLGLHAGVLAVDLVAAQGLAREAARMAAVTDDTATRDALRDAAGAQPVEVDLLPPSPRTPGALVTAEVRVQSRAFHPFGVPIWLPARATTRVEDQ
jgi:hypothetical protein